MLPYALKKLPAVILIVIILLFITPGNIKASEDKFSSSYIYFGMPASYIHLVENAKGSLNQISPSYFDLNDDGTLKLNQSLDTNLVKNMHTRGIRVVPFLSNHWDRQKGINALNNRAALAQQLADAIQAYGLDGVDVDIENVTEKERAQYVDFVRLLREKLPPGKSVTAAVAPNPYNWNTGWQGSYDYSGLAQYCDHLVIMAYDEHYQGGAEGPVASAPFVEASIKYALKKVPPEKIVLGLPFYGRYWKQGGTYGGYGVSASTVENMIVKYKGAVTYDMASRSPKAVITIKAGDEKPVILGKQLEAGTYNFWYENDKSLKYKLRLVQKYNLKGAASWSLGQESSGTWDYYKLWLNGKYYTDIDGHWAQSSIFTADMNGWMIGVTSTKFMPDAPLTRAQTAVVLSRMYGLNVYYYTKASFKDTQGYWAWKEIEAARDAGLVKGIGDGKFGPDEKITREQMAVILDRLLIDLEEPEALKNPFIDVSRDKSPWAYDSILKMAHYGIVQGMEEDKFVPSGILTRAQMAALLERISVYLSGSGE